ncbi:kif7 [Symbiodinium natans]|uniref:Kif7 protein n=1 Tax=Symbiodinium natans TaxID=878477 RepID=A0A812J7K8_9DINO|nr:kif7 [Symbiodinium natans]
MQRSSPNTGHALPHASWICANAGHERRSVTMPSVQQEAEWHRPPPGIPSPSQVAHEGATHTPSPTTLTEEAAPEVEPDEHKAEQASEATSARSRKSRGLPPRGLARPARQTDSNRYWCSFHLQQAYTQFAVVPAIIGKKGCNTRAIFEKTGAKIRVRGRGSGHMEAASGREAPAGLMVTVSSNSFEWDGFVEAVRLTGELLDRVQHKMYEMTDKHKHLGELCWQVTLHNGNTHRLAAGQLVAEDTGEPVKLQQGFGILGSNAREAAANPETGKSQWPASEQADVDVMATGLAR